MFRFDLRTKIAGTVFVLVAVATLLIDFVFVVTLQKELVQQRVVRSRAGLLSLQEALTSGTGPSVMADLGWLRNAAGAAAVVFVDQQKRKTVSGPLAELGPGLMKMAMAAAQDGRADVAYFGQTWGVFWRMHRFALVSTPVGSDGAGAAIAVSLESIYGDLRDAQKVIFVYLLINGVLLTLIGTFRLSQVAIKPIERLLKRAESYQDDGSVLFVSERGDNEFSRLSRALNRMLQRISDDREKLRQSVHSLEKANIDLKKAHTDIIQAEKLASVGRLSSGIAHEIGNPIGIVLGYLELLQQPEISEDERKEYILRSQKEINRINTIIRQLLDFSRPASGASEAISVHEVLTDMIEIVKVQPLMAKVAVSVALSARRHQVVADPNQLRQVFLNLAINAADAVSLLPEPGTGRLRIETENPQPGEHGGSDGNRMLKIRFLDNGPGIAEADMGNIFDPFFTTKAPGKGTGLGLSVCFMIVQNLGGRIFAESQSGAGTVVTIYLPLDTGEKP
jgi:signal transduction histidine kinase